MSRFRRRLTYGNVIATLALFLALTGGVVWAGGKISGKTIKKNSEPGNRIKKNTITSNRVKDNTLLSADFANGAPGTTILDATASNMAGATNAPASTTPVTFTGGTSFTPSRKARVQGRKVSFTPVNGHSYLAMAEIKGNAVDADGAGGNSCFPEVQIYVNGNESVSVGPFQNLSTPAPFPNTANIDWDERPVGLIDKGETQTFTAKVIGDTHCGPATRLDSLRLVVVSFG